MKKHCTMKLSYIRTCKITAFSVSVQMIFENTFYFLFVGFRKKQYLCTRYANSVYNNIT